MTPFQQALLAWAEATPRDLPWRRTRDPWAVLVAETMLQQTTVARVAPRFEAFLAAFPTPTRCAAAPPAAVVRAWAGLGYNRRAVSLHRAARLLVDRHGGGVPADVAALEALPGVGPYTARAVASFAFHRDVGVVDTNAGRVLARAVAGRPLRPAEAQALADRLVPAGRSQRWNEAVMDLGAGVCTAHAPRCGACPLADLCAWREQGQFTTDPAVATAGASRPQPPFRGSDRQGRGRLVAALRDGPVGADRLADAAGWPADPARARRAADALVADGLAEFSDGRLRLPS